jgi:hypothetical protein
LGWAPWLVCAIVGLVVLAASGIVSGGQARLQPVSDPG